MCSLIFSTKPIENLESVNRLLKFRGPDHTEMQIHNGHTFVHNLLSICGSFTPQPLTSNNKVVLFNGEIYNYKDLGDFDNDTKCIIPMYEKYGEEFASHLDGEFAIVLVDYALKRVIITSDTFKTKPLFYSISKSGIGAASYKTPLQLLGYDNIVKAEPNTTVIVDLEKFELIRKITITKWDLRQYKTNFDDWTRAFEESIRKRTQSNREKMFIGISSGYDSGAIACEMAKQKMYFKGYTHIGREDVNVINRRKQMLMPYCENEQYMTSPSDWEVAHKFIEQNTEEFYYTVRSGRSNYNEFNLKLIDDNGSNQFSNLCSKAKRDGYKIHLSGMGGDEIFSDYGFGGNSKYSHSNFGGLFPNNLESIFPWPSFYGSTMESYLAKEEYVGGVYGMESRYPFLDKMVVQEFLWISQSLKNSNYKNVLHNYLTINNFPFAQGQKVGF